MRILCAHLDPRGLIAHYESRPAVEVPESCAFLRIRQKNGISLSSDFRIPPVFGYKLVLFSVSHCEGRRVDGASPFTSTLSSHGSVDRAPNVHARRRHLVRSSVSANDRESTR